MPESRLPGAEPKAAYAPWGCACGNWTNAGVCEGCGRTRTENGYGEVSESEQARRKELATLATTDPDCLRGTCSHRRHQRPDWWRKK